MRPRQRRSRACIGAATDEPMTLRRRIAAAFDERSSLLWLVWLGAPLLCLAVPGPGVLLGALWVIAFLWLGRQRPQAIGIRRPASWPRLLGLAAALALGAWLLAEFVTAPLAETVAGQRNLDTLADLQGNWGKFLFWLALGWAAGGVIEELLFRGFMIGIGVRLLGERLIWPIAIGSSAVFGLSHFYQGPAGMIITGTTGFVFAAIFIVAGRNLVLVIVVHGLVNTIYLGLAFLGLRALA